MIFKNKIVPLLAMLLFMSLAPLSYGIAASVREVTMDEMLQACQFVFEGRVLSVEAKENSNKRIHTDVTLAIQDIIKGEHPDNTITLRFVGGTVGDVTLVVSDMEFPEKGEHGIYFVESLKRQQVNPLYGWSQGHFLVETDAETGTEKVMTRSRKPVTAVTSSPPVTSTHLPEKLSTGAARGLTLGQEGGKGLSPGQFKKALREQLGTSQ